LILLKVSFFPRMVGQDKKERSFKMVGMGKWLPCLLVLQWELRNKVYNSYPICQVWINMNTIKFNSIYFRFAMLFSKVLDLVVIIFLGRVIFEIFLHIFNILFLSIYRHMVSQTYIYIYIYIYNHLNFLKYIRGLKTKFSFFSLKRQIY